MGQAKLRGTYEERKVQAIKRNSETETFVKNKVITVGGRRRDKSLMLAIAAALAIPSETVIADNCKPKLKR